jgi:hypothetical protein
LSVAHGSFAVSARTSDDRRSEAMPGELFLTCPTCAALRAAEQPPCADGHGADCPDRACVECGTALYADPAVSFGAQLATIAVQHAA